jgi:hypothetical protein
MNTSGIHVCVRERERFLILTDASVKTCAVQSGRRKVLDTFVLRAMSNSRPDDEGSRNGITTQKTVVFNLVHAYVFRERKLFIFLHSELIGLGINERMTPLKT